MVISMDVYKNGITTLKASNPGVAVLTKYPKLLEMLAHATVTALPGQSAVEDHIASVSVESSLVRGRSKTGQPDVEEAAPEPTLDPIQRPNGEMYNPRKWGSLFDIEVLRKSREHSKYILVQGDPGTGKTVLGEAAYGEEMYTVMISGDTEVSELVGSWIPKPEGGYMWVDGPLVKAAEEGKVIFLDEIGLADPKVLSVLYSLMDGRQELLITQNPVRGVVKAQKGFFVYAATNPHAPGVRLSEALLSRFAVHAEITTDYDMAIVLGVPKKIVGAAQNINKRKKENVIEWAPQFRDLLAYRDLETIFGRQFALENMIASAPERDRHEVGNILQLVYGEHSLESAKV